MRFGYCAAIEHAQTVADAGYDFIELSLAGTLKPEQAEDDVMPALLAQMEASPIKAEAFNVLLPGDLRVTGPDIDPDRQTAYLRAAFTRAQALGGQVIVFGSGKARMVPDGVSLSEAAGQILTFLDRASPLAAAHGITVVIEPLNRGECNIINSVTEGMNYINTLRHPSIAILSDLYHVSVERQTFEQTRNAGDALKHVHVAGRENRRPPTDDDLDFLKSFFRVLKEMDYDGRISVEGNTVDVASQAPVALGVMRQAWRIA
jgi:D-psicose/D-tagatose/L-ribulose 3-epimerase